MKKSNHTALIEMKKKYQYYLQSSKWRNKSRYIKNERNYICEICGNKLLFEVIEMLDNSLHPSWNIPEIARFSDTVSERYGDDNKLIQIHHRSYKNIGSETIEELACVCAPCHVLITENTPGNGLENAWLIAFKKAKNILLKIEVQKKLANPELFMGYVIKPEFESDLEEQKNDYFLFRKDYFDIEDEFE